MKFLITGLLLVLPFAQADTRTGKVVKVTDCDTVTVLDSSNTQHKVRLQGIDAPERKQPYGRKSGKYLSEVVSGQVVVVDWSKRDRYGRIIGKVLLDSQDMNLRQIEGGLAWHYKKYAREQSEQDRESYAAAENEARAARIGLWQKPGPIPPWEWRAGVR